MSRLSLTIAATTLGFCLFLFLATRVIVKKHYLALNSFMFWLFFAILFALPALFPAPVKWLMAELGFAVPANGVFYIFIGFLVCHTFLQSVEIAKLKMRMIQLIQVLSIENRQEPAKNTHDRRNG